MPCFNAARWLPECLESIFAQNYENLEILVHDDGSTDGSAEVLRRYGDRVALECHPNRGSAAARNALIRRSTGEFIQFMDSDDFLLPGKFERQLRQFEENPWADVVTGPAMYQRQNDDGTTQRSTRDWPLGPDFDVWEMLTTVPIPLIESPLFRGDAVRAAAPVKEAFRCNTSYALFLSVTMAGARWYSGEGYGAVYRRWSDGTLSQRDQGDLYRTKCELYDGIEAWLAERNMLSPKLTRNLCNLRGAAARTLWSTDREVSCRTYESIHRLLPDWLPLEGSASPRFRMLYRVGGFRLAHAAGDVADRLRRQFGRQAG